MAMEKKKKKKKGAIVRPKWNVINIVFFFLSLSIFLRIHRFSWDFIFFNFQISFRNFSNCLIFFFFLENRYSMHFRFGIYNFLIPVEFFKFYSSTFRSADNSILFFFYVFLAIKSFKPIKSCWMSNGSMIFSTFLFFFWNFQNSFIIQNYFISWYFPNFLFFLFRCHSNARLVSFRIFCF